MSDDHPVKLQGISTVVDSLPAKVTKFGKGCRLVLAFCVPEEMAEDYPLQGFKDEGKILPKSTPLSELPDWFPFVEQVVVLDTRRENCWILATRITWSTRTWRIWMRAKIAMRRDPPTCTTLS